MKFDFLKFLIFLGVSALVVWGIYELGEDNACKWQLAVGTGVSLISYSILLSLKLLENPRSQVNLRVVTYIFFFISLMLNFIFSFFSFSSFVYFIPNGILILVALFIAKGIIQSKQ